MPIDDEIKCPTVQVNPSRIQYCPPIPKGFKIVVDSNEQKPLKFGGGIVTVRKKLNVGDYSIDGMESSVIIERKSQADFYGSITGDNRERLNLQFERGRGAGFKAFVIECEESVLMTPELTFSGVNPNSAYGTITSLEVKHGFHVYYGNRSSCALKIANWLICYYNRAHHVRRVLKPRKKKGTV
jgi:ERCC4-type nuclease